MHFLFSVVRLFPFWALPMAMVISELGLYYRRRESPMQLACFGSAALLISSAAVWIFFRGDMHSDQWVRYMIGN